MRVAMYGVGGAGGYFGARLAQAGVDVVFVARGEHLRAMRERGLRLVAADGDVTIHPVRVGDDPARLGPADVVFFAVKTWQLEDAARAAAPMLAPDGFVVPLQNGVEAPGVLAGVLGPERVLGGTCGTISRVSEPGVITSIGRVNFVSFGELDDRPSERTAALEAVFERAGVKAVVPPSIHTAMWEKFMFVATMGGIGAVTRAPIGITRALPETRELAVSSMREIAAVAAARGIALPEDAIERTMALVDGLSPDGTASLQRDIIDGRPSELDAWCGAVVRLGREAGVATPVNDFFYACLLPQERAARERAAG